LKALSPNNDWVYLSLLAESSSCDLRDTGYTKMSKFVQAQGDDFELGVGSDGIALTVRLRAEAIDKNDSSSRAL
jgi:hypothetical protein